MLTPIEIANLGAKAIEAAKALHTALDAAMAELNKHNASKGAEPANAGPLSVALGSSATILEQLQKHVDENTPQAPATPAS